MCSLEDDSSVPLDRLEAEITTLAGHLNAATCRWLSLVGEFDRREGWAAWGCRSCAQWLSWRCGVTPGTAREQTRVARALDDLPGIRAAFAEGRLSYSQARALTRVATSELEDDLLELARHATGGQLERLVRGYRSAAAQLDVANRAHAGRYLLYHHDHDGSLVIEARLTADEGELVLAALGAAAEGLQGSRPADGSAETPSPRADSPRADADADAVPAETPSPPHARADALVALAETTLQHGPSPRAGGNRHQILLLVDHETLRADAPGRCEVGEGEPLAPETARRLSCDASVVPVAPAAAARSTLGAAPGASHRISVERSPRATAAAAFRGAVSGGSSTPTTSCTGPAAARPTSATSSSSAATITASSTRGAAPSTPAPAGSPSIDRTASESRTAIDPDRRRRACSPCRPLPRPGHRRRDDGPAVGGRPTRRRPCDRAPAVAGGAPPRGRDRSRSLTTPQPGGTRTR